MKKDQNDKGAAPDEGDPADDMIGDESRNLHSEKLEPPQDSQNHNQ